MAHQSSRTVHLVTEDLEDSKTLKPLNLARPITFRLPYDMAPVIEGKETSHHVESLGKVDTTTSEPVKGWHNLAEDAHLATEDEHNTTFLQGLRQYPKACAWSALVSMCIIMDG